MSCPALAEVGAIIPCAKCSRPHVKLPKTNTCIDCRRAAVRESHRRANYKKNTVPKIEAPDESTAALDTGIANRWLRMPLTSRAEA
jgi:hypothetical protein